MTRLQQPPAAQAPGFLEGPTYHAAGLQESRARRKDELKAQFADLALKRKQQKALPALYQAIKDDKLTGQVVSDYFEPMKEYFAGSAK